MNIKKLCPVCNKELEEKKSSNYQAKFCSYKCRLINKKNKAIIYNKPWNITASSVGAMHELIVCVDLIKRGYDVFRSVTPSASCDMMILKEGKYFRVEVTTAHIDLCGKLSTPKKDPSRFDILAVVCRDGRIIYENDSFGLNDYV